MTIDQRLHALRAQIRQGESLAEAVARVRVERLAPTKAPSRKQLAKLREMIAGLGSEELAKLQEEYGDEG